MLAERWVVNWVARKADWLAVRSAAKSAQKLETLTVATLGRKMAEMLVNCFRRTLCRATFLVELIVNSSI